METDKVDLIQVWEKACANVKFQKSMREIGQRGIPFHGMFPFINLEESIGMFIRSFYPEEKYEITFGKIKQQITKDEFSRLEKLHSCAMSNTDSELFYLAKFGLL